MATAKIETVTKKVEKEVPEKVYTLSLSQDEAETLYALLGNVEGNIATTYNKHAYSVWNALGSAGGIGYRPFSGRFSINYGVITAKRLPASV